MLFKSFCFFLPFLLASLATAQPKKILVLGDSLTEGYGVSKEAAFPNQLQRILQKAGHEVEVIGAGSSGATSASGLSRLKWHLKKKPDLLILALGANDGLRGVKLSATKDNLARTIDLAKQNQIKVFLAGMKIPMNYGEDYRREFESLYQNLVKEKQIGLIPFLLEGVAAEPKYNLADGIHPNEEGHQLIAQNIFKYIKDDL